MSTGSIGNTYLPQTGLPNGPGGPGDPNKVGSGQPAVGTGALVGAGQAPDAPVARFADAILASVHGLMPKISGDQLDTLLLSVVSKMKDTIDATERDKIKTNTEAKRGALLEKQKSLEESNKKLEEAEAKKKSTSIWDKIKVAFQAIGAAIALIAGAALLFVPGAQAAGIALLATGALMAFQTIDSIYAKTAGDGKGMIATLGEKLAKAFGADDETAGWVGMGLNIGFQIAAAITVAAVGIVATGGAATATMVPLIVGIAQSVIQIGTAAGDAAVAGVNYQATELQAEAKTKQADAKKMEALTQQFDAMIDLAMARLKGAAEAMDSMLDAITDAVRDRGDTMSRAKLSA